jgi:hypothetical protein
MSKELRERQNTIDDLRDALGMYDTSAKED